jgi:hypothetical protein
MKNKKIKKEFELIIKIIDQFNNEKIYYTDIYNNEK